MSRSEHHLIVAQCDARLDVGLDLSLDTEGTFEAPKCDEPAWLMFGISMAGYNALLSLIVALKSFALALWPTKAASWRHAPPMPGQAAPSREIEEMIRVDHAGEFGAVQIYRGQRRRVRPQRAQIACSLAGPPRWKRAKRSILKLSTASWPSAACVQP
ncbi:MAG: demethoxyubiquinone hydroxylase family protein [Terricaulis sp.]